MLDIYGGSFSRMGMLVLWLVLLGVTWSSAVASAPMVKTMKSFVQVVKYIEMQNPTMSLLDMLRNLRAMCEMNNLFLEYYLEFVERSVVQPMLPLDPAHLSFLMAVLPHTLTGQVEQGVVFGGDGTTVALAPLLLGMEVGLVSNPMYLMGFYPIVFNGGPIDFGTSLEDLGLEGVWDNVKSPQTYTLIRETTLLYTDAFINAALDGFIFAQLMSNPDTRPLSLSTALRQYYLYSLGKKGIDKAPTTISVFRRQNFQPSVDVALVSEMVVAIINLYTVFFTNKVPVPVTAVSSGVQRAIEEFVECPKVISRATWGAAPPKTMPKQLNTPVPYWIIHHSVQPSMPCMSFSSCATALQTMQAQHQLNHPDIRFSFVVGADGYIYEGRGWNAPGYQTSKYNRNSYGVCFMGDYTSSLPQKQAVSLVRDQLPACAIGLNYLSPTYAVKAHRQLVTSLTCPGKRLYMSVMQWPKWEK